MAIRTGSGAESTGNRTGVRSWGKFVVVVAMLACGASFLYGGAAPNKINLSPTAIITAGQPLAPTVVASQQESMSDNMRLSSSMTSSSGTTIQEVPWPILRRHQQHDAAAKTKVAAGFSNSDRMRWTGTSCQPNSKYADADDAARKVFRDIIAYSDLLAIHDAASCFFYGRGVWNDTLDVVQFRRDVAAVRAGKAKTSWTCTVDQLSRQASLRMAFTKNYKNSTKLKQSEFGGRPRQVRYAQLQHGECNLVGLKDPYSLLVALSTLRGGRVALNYTVIEIIGDSIHRGLFATIVAMLRGVGERAYFDRQAHTHLKYIVTSTGDHFTLDMGAPNPDDTLLEVRYHAVFGYQLESFPPQLRLDSAKAPTVLITGGLEHAEFDCHTRSQRMGPMNQHAGLINAQVSTAQANNLEAWKRVMAAVAAAAANPNSTTPKLTLFPLPPEESLIIMKSGVQPQSFMSYHLGGCVRGYHSLRNHLYREVVENAYARVETFAKEGKLPSREARHYLEASPSVFFLEEIRLYNLADEGPAKLASYPINMEVKGAGPGGVKVRVINASSMLDPETIPSDGLHSSCTMHWSLPERVGGWHLQHSTCRGWRERGNVQLVASMIVATARQRFEAEQQSLQQQRN